MNESNNKSIKAMKTATNLTESQCDGLAGSIAEILIALLQGPSLYQLTEEKKLHIFL
jgi:hypothetical protein